MANALEVEKHRYTLIIKLGTTASLSVW